MNNLMVYKKMWYRMLVIAFLVITPLCAKAISIQNMFYSKVSRTFLDGTKPITASLMVRNNVVYTESFPSVVFKQGFFSILMGDRPDAQLPEQVLDQAGIYLAIRTDQEVATFSITAVPYAFRADFAEEVRAASANAVVGVFPNSVTMSRGINVRPIDQLDSIFVADTLKNQISIGTSSTFSGAVLNVAGTLNATNLYVRGIPLKDSFAWKPALNATPQKKNLYFRGGRIGISNTLPQFTVQVGSGRSGKVNATGYLVQGRPLSSSQEWKVSPQNPNEIYYKDLQSKVGIGIVNPKEKVDAIGAIRLGSSPSRHVGALQWSGTQFLGATSPTVLSPIGGILGDGRVRQIPVWQIESNGLPNYLTNYPRLGIDGLNGRLAINVVSPTSIFTVREPFVNSIIPLAIFGREVSPTVVIANTGNVRIVTTNSRAKLAVGGTLDATDYTINGEVLSLSFSVNDHWGRTPSTKHIYYTAGNVGIGRPDPTSPLEIAQPNGSPDQDPVISFTNLQRNSSFTLGVSTKTKSTFRIESGLALGRSRPVFVAQDDRFGVGVDPPKANLHVSGNRGVVVRGPVGVSTNMPATGPGTRLQFFPPKGSFTLGRLDKSLLISTSDITATAWDKSSLGIYSIGMGHNVLPRGVISTVIGGSDNMAAGAYATILGGTLNRASGDFTMALGRNARANHHGSFVFSDYSGAGPVSASTKERQFLIRARGGMGIGTSNTMRFLNSPVFAPSALVVIPLQSTHDIMRFYGNKNEFVALTPSGTLSIGYPALTRSNMGLMTSRPLTINEKDPKGLLTMRAKDSQTMIMNVYNNLEVTTPSFVIEATGNIGIGKRGYSRETGFVVSVASGNLMAENFVLPDGASLSPNRRPEAWKYTATPNIYFVSGNVGIGTPSPSRMVHLSNRGGRLFSLVTNPAIGFDIDNVTKSTIGIDQASPGLFQINSGENFLAIPGLVVSRNNVGVFTRNPRAALDVSGNMFISQKILVGTTNQTYSFATPRININRLFVRGQIISTDGNPFVKLTNPSEHLFYDSLGDPNNVSNIGIGTSTPRTMMEVVGTLNIQAGSALTSLFTSRIQTASLTLRGMKLLDSEGGGVGSLIVDHQDLVFVTDYRRSLSDVFSPGSGPGGDLIAWQNGPNVPSFSFLIHTPIRWTSPAPAVPSQVLITGNINIAKTKRFNSSYQYQNRVQIGTANMDFFLASQSTISHDGIVTNSNSFTGKTVGITYDPWPGQSGFAGINTTGLAVNLAQQREYSMVSNAQAIGLDVDVSNVNVQTVGDKGIKYAALFNRDSVPNATEVAKPIVGIGSTPNAELDVRGTVSANFFVISNRLSMATLNVPSVIDLRSPSRIGIGTTQPNATLTIAGTASANRMIVKYGTKAASLIASKAQLTIREGHVGIGITNPQAQWELNRIFRGLTNKDYSVETIGVSVNAAINKKITTLAVQISTSGDRNVVGDNPTVLSPTLYNIKGININLSDIVPESVDKLVTGLSVAVPDGQVAATFMGGNVGIGVTNPSYALDVNGTIAARDFANYSLALNQEGAVFDFLGVNASPSMRVTGPMFVSGSMNIGELRPDNLRVLNPIRLDGITLRVINEVVAEDLVVTRSRFTTLQADQMLARTATFSSVGINKTVPDASLDITGALAASTISAKSTLEALTASWNNHIYINTGMGINNSNPSAMLDVVTINPTRPFSATNNLTFNALKIQAVATRNGQAVGVVFSPDSDEKSKQVGSAIVAILRKGGSIPTSSELAIITDPITGTPSEHIRISRQGFVGIGRTAPVVALDVTGSVRVRGSLTVKSDTPSFFVNRIGSPRSLAITGPFVTFQSTVNTTQNVIVYRPVLLNPFIPRRQPDAAGGIFTNPINGKLSYTSTLSDGFWATGDIKPTVSISVTNAIPFFGSGRVLAGSSDFRWTNSTFFGSALSVVQIASSNHRRANGSFAIINSINNVSQNMVVTAQKIRMTLKDRSVASVSKLDGLVIRLPNGALQVGEIAYGLKVDTTRLVTDTFTPSGTLVKGKKAAAIFLVGTEAVGNVGIFTSSNATNRVPSATVHIVSTSTQNPILVEGAKQALRASNTGLISIGGDDNSAKLAVTLANQGISNSNKYSAMSVQNSQGKSIFEVLNTGEIGIGTKSATQRVTVHESFQGTTLSSGVLGSKTLTMGATNGFVVNDEGVGIGTTQPQAQLHLVRSFALPSELTTNFTAQKTTMRINDITITKPITILEVVTTTNARSAISGVSPSQPAIVTGLNINLANIVSTQTSTTFFTSLVGIKSEVPSVTNGVAYPAVIKGGKVGVGVSNPSVALDIAGTIRARNIFASTAINLQGATFNHLIMPSGITSINTMDISRATRVSPIREISVNQSASANIYFLAPLSRRTLQASTFLAKQVTFNQVIIGRLTSDTARTPLLVSGSAYIKRNLRATRNIELTTQLTATRNLRINANLLVFKGATVNVTSTIGATVLIMNRSTQNVPVNYGSLFITSAGNLRFRSDTTIWDLTKKKSGAFTRIPVFDLSDNLLDTAALFWTSSVANSTALNTDWGTIQIGGTGLTSAASVEVKSSALNNVQTSVTAQKIRLNFKNRTTSSASKFSGLLIQALPPGGLITDPSFGSRDVGYGLYVDTSTLRETSSTQRPGSEDQSIQGTKAAAVFLSGRDATTNVWIANRGAVASNQIKGDLHVMGQLLGLSPFRIDNLSDPTVFPLPVNMFGILVSRNATVAFSIPTSDVSISGKEAFSLRAGEEALIMSIANSKPLLALNDKGLALGTKTSTATFMIKNTDATMTTLRVDGFAATLKNRLVVTGAGLVGVHKASPEASLHVGSTEDRGIGNLLSIAAGSKLALEIAPTGNVGIRTIPNGKYSLIVSRNIAAMTPTATMIATDLPTILRPTPTGKPAGGLLVRQGNAFGFLGQHAVRSTFGRKDATVLQWGGNASSLTAKAGNLAFESGVDSTRIMTVATSSRIAIGATNPAATLHIKGSGSLIFKSETTGVAGSKLIITSEGKIGIATSNPSATLAINGKLKASSILDAPSPGTELKAPTVNVSANIKTARNFVVKSTLGRPVVKTLSSVNLLVKSDSDQPVAGVSIRTREILTARITELPLIKPSHSLYGIRVNMSDTLLTSDPTFGATRGKINAAQFYGGTVSIGKMPVEDVVPVGNSTYRGTPQFQVYGMNNKGILIPTGTIAGFTTSSNVAKNTFIIRAVGARLVATSSISPDEFTALGMTPTQSERVYRDLISNTLTINGVANQTLVVVDPFVRIRDKASIANINAYTTANVLISPYLKGIRTMLSQHVTTNVYELSVSSNTNVGQIYLRSGASWNGSDNKSILQTGAMGIGFMPLSKMTEAARLSHLAMIDKALVVSGDMRVGVVTQRRTLQARGFGGRFYFSGGPVTTENNDGENTDSLWMGRYNSAEGASALRLNIGESDGQNPTSKFIVSPIDSLGKNPLDAFTVKTAGYSDPAVIEQAILFSGGNIDNAIVQTVGRVGVGITQPEALFHVVGNMTHLPMVFDPTKSVVLLENVGTPTGVSNKMVTLALGITGSDANKDDHAYFMSFLVPTTNSDVSNTVSGMTFTGAKKLQGGISLRANDTWTALSPRPAVRYVSGAADYAEYIPKANPSATMNPGEVVGIKDGKVSYDTAHADQIMVLSYSPIVVGNWPGRDASKLALVSFLGQVQVTVTGVVATGDYILASGKSDGTAIAMSAAAIPTSFYDRIVGRALSSAIKDGKVHTLIGFPYATQLKAEKLSQITKIQDQLTMLKATNTELKEMYVKKLDERQKWIESLRLKVAAKLKASE